MPATIAVTVYVPSLAKSKPGDEIADNKAASAGNSDNTKGSGETSANPLRKHAKLIAIVLEIVAQFVRGHTKKGTNKIV